MNSQLTPFVFEDALVRVQMDENGNPWFVAKDVCNVLELGNVTEATRGLDDDEKKQLDTNIINPEVGGRGTILISESGLYSLIFRSRKPEAKRFRKWVTSDVIPSIRRTGSYTMPTASNASFQRRAMLAQLENMPEEGKHLRPHVRSKLLWCAMKAAEMDNTGTEGVVQNFSMFCRLVGEAPFSLEGQMHAFVEECLEVAPGARTRAQNIYTALRSWWRQKGKGGMPSEKMLATALDARFSKKKSNTMLYLDCAIGKDWRLPA